jgi:hypothetical protein
MGNEFPFLSDAQIEKLQGLLVLRLAFWQDQSIEQNMSVRFCRDFLGPRNCSFGQSVRAKIEALLASAV